MANLTTEQINEVATDIGRRYSSIWQEIPVTKAQLRGWLSGTVDAEVEAAEVAIFQNTPAGPAKDWLQANPAIGRDMIEAIVNKRKEVL